LGLRSDIAGGIRNDIYLYINVGILEQAVSSEVEQLDVGPEMYWAATRSSQIERKVIKVLLESGSTGERTYFLCIRHTSRQDIPHVHLSTGTLFHKHRRGMQDES
jgi:hypothetical protein